MCYKMAKKSCRPITQKFEQIAQLTSLPSLQNKFPACNIFELPDYFWNDPLGFSDFYS